jgi:hypothetical protein
MWPTPVGNGCAHAAEGAVEPAVSPAATVGPAARRYVCGRSMSTPGHYSCGPHQLLLLLLPCEGSALQRTAGIGKQDSRVLSAR